MADQGFVMDSNTYIHQNQCKKVPRIPSLESSGPSLPYSKDSNIIHLLAAQVPRGSSFQRQKHPVAVEPEDASLQLQPKGNPSCCSAVQGCECLLSRSHLSSFSSLKNEVALRQPLTPCLDWGYRSRTAWSTALSTSTSCL